MLHRAGMSKVFDDASTGHPAPAHVHASKHSASGSMPYSQNVQCDTPCLPSMTFMRADTCECIHYAATLLIAQRMMETVMGGVTGVTWKPGECTQHARMLAGVRPRSAQFSRGQEAANCLAGKHHAAALGAGAAPHDTTTVPSPGTSSSPPSAASARDCAAAALATADTRAAAATTAAKLRPRGPDGSGGALASPPSASEAAP